MAFYKWKDSFSVGVPELDAQHQKFLDYLNQLYEAVNAKEAEQVTGVLLDRFAEYVDVHFRDEENFLKKIGYPHLQIQEKQHSFFKEKIRQLKENAPTGFENADRTSLPYLNDWFLNHILEEDRKYGDFIAGGQ